MAMPKREDTVVRRVPLSLVEKVDTMVQKHRKKVRQKELAAVKARRESPNTP